MPAVLDTPEVVDYEAHDLSEAHPPVRRSPCRILAHYGAVSEAAERPQAPPDAASSPLGAHD